MAKEARGHAPGHEMTGGGGEVRQRERMGEGHGPMAGGSFGIGATPGTARIKHPEGEPNGTILSDHERSAPPAFKLGPNSMHASHNPTHGAHHHPHSVHHAHVPKGKRPHHVG